MSPEKPKYINPVEFGPEKKIENQVELPPNNLPASFDDTLDNLKFLKDKRKGDYFQTIDYIKQMTQGEDPEGLKEQFYEGWKDEDFVKLLEQLGEDVE